MLGLINAERKRAGVTPVVLGVNNAAQLHAESSLANCTSSHWGADGLKPYMRYSLAGGYQSNGENGHGLDYCITSADGYRAIDSIRAAIQEAMAGWMHSSGHRANILDPTHRKVNIGISWDTYNEVMYQHFEGEYVEYDSLPSIMDGVLSLSGTVKDEVRISGDNLIIQVYYDRPPSSLTRGQLSRTYCYNNGTLLLGLRQPLSDGSFWPTSEFTIDASSSACTDPYNVPADSPAPRSVNQALSFWEQAYNASKLKPPKGSVTVPWVTAKRWTIGGGTFAVEADLRDILAAHGKGVYTVFVWGRDGRGKDVVVSQYSIFHGVTPPTTYDPSIWP